MKTSLLLIALLAGALAGTGSALLVAATDTDGRGLQVAPTPEAASPGIAELRARNDALEERVRSLEHQLALEASRRESAVPAEARPAAVELEDIESLLAALQEPNQPPPAGLETMVSRVLEDKEARERAEREAERRAQREQRLEERMERMAQELGLDPTQRATVKDALWERDEARNALFQDLRGGGFGDADRDTVRQRMQEIQASADTALQFVLSPAQYEQYQEEYEDRGRWRGRGRGRGEDDDD